MTLEAAFDPAFAASLALREKQIQQSYRPVIGVHKWFARRPGTLFRSLLLAEFNGAAISDGAYFRAHDLHGVIADPFMGGGTTLVEANRLGFSVVGTDVNPMAWWIVRQELGQLDLEAFLAAATAVMADVAREVGDLYQTTCLECSGTVPIKYFLWVKTQACPTCGHANDLFPGYLLAEAERHPRHVLVCPDCTRLVELEQVPRAATPAPCPHCGGRVQVEGPARDNRVACRACGTPYRYPNPEAGPPRHRLFAIEYHCPACKPAHADRFFKSPDLADRHRFERARQRFASAGGLPIPDDPIPLGDETTRLLRWGYRYYREMFNDRQLLGLGLLQQRIRQVPDPPVRHALLTVFSDSLRYQNMLCRYDTYALKCQDIFSVHGFPVGLVQCENNLLGIPGVGSGSFVHFVEKYRRAKAFCAQPFETRQVGSRKRLEVIAGERIAAEPVENLPETGARQAWLVCGTATDVPLPPASLDGVFTDPPYFANVQYAELMDFCYVWLRPGLRQEFPQFDPPSTRTQEELTGNVTLGRDLEHFAEGLSRVFRRFAAALKPRAPFVFTYHHNQIEAYAPVVLALLDARLSCRAVLPAPAEMSASLHINNTGSSTLDSVFVARLGRKLGQRPPPRYALCARIAANLRAVIAGGVRPTLGDARCLTSGHLARLCVEKLEVGWQTSLPTAERLRRVQEALAAVARSYDAEALAPEALDAAQTQRDGVGGARLVQGMLFAEAADASAV